MNHVISRKQLLRTALLTLETVQSKTGQNGHAGHDATKTNQTVDPARLICTINLRRVFGGRLELVGPLIVLEIMCLINVFLCPHERLSYRTLNLAGKIVVNA